VKLAPGASADVSFDIPIERLMTVQQDGTSKLVRGDYTITVASAAPSPVNEKLGVSVIAKNIGDLPKWGK
jgi:beta-glucosidase